jgi:hypothetical protein
MVYGETVNPFPPNLWDAALNWGIILTGDIVEKFSRVYD